MVRSHEILLENYFNKDYIDFDDDGSDSYEEIIYCNYMIDDELTEIRECVNQFNLIRTRGLFIKPTN